MGGSRNVEIHDALIGTIAVFEGASWIDTFITVYFIKKTALNSMIKSFLVMEIYQQA